MKPQLCFFKTFSSLILSVNDIFKNIPCLSKIYIYVVLCENNSFLLSGNIYLIFLHKLEGYFSSHCTLGDLMIVFLKFCIICLYIVWTYLFLKLSREIFLCIYLFSFNLFIGITSSIVAVMHDSKNL